MGRFAPPDPPPAPRGGRGSGGGEAKPKTAIQHGSLGLHCFGHVVIEHDGMGGWMWTKSKEAKEARGVLAAHEGTPLGDEEMEEDKPAAPGSSAGKPK